MSTPATPTRVTFTASNLGTLEDPAGYRFALEFAQAGDVGELLPDPHPTLPEWRIVRVELADGRIDAPADAPPVTRYVPVHPSHYEELA